MENLILLILRSPLISPFRRKIVAFALAVRSGQKFDLSGVWLHFAIGWPFNIVSSIDNWDRNALIEAVSRTRSKAARIKVFKMLVRRSNFLAAQKLANALPFEGYSMRVQIAIIRNGYFGTDGVRSDGRLTQLLVRLGYSCQKLNDGTFSQLLSAIRLSGFATKTKIEILERIESNSNLTSSTRKSLDSVKASLTRKLGVRRQLNSRFANALNSNPVKNADVLTLKSMWPVVRDTFSRGELIKFAQRGLKSRFVSVIHTPFLCRVLSDDEVLAVLTEEEIFRRLAEFPQSIDFKTATPRGLLAQSLFAKTCDFWTTPAPGRTRSRFAESSADTRDLIIRLLAKRDAWQTVDHLLRESIESDTLLEIQYARGYLAFTVDDFASATSIFSSILEQNPNHKNAWIGYQWASVRALGGLDTVEVLRRRIGRGAVQAGRGTDSRRFSDVLAVTSRQWRGDYRRDTLASINPEWEEVSAKYGDRWFDFSRFPDADKDRDILIFPNFGVSDEVREAYHYGEIAAQYRTVTIVCDPRLISIFSRSFPSINFVPFSRRVKANYIEDKRIAPLKDAPLVLSNFIPNSLGGLLSSSNTLITTAQNFVARRLSDRKFELNPGGYLKTNRQDLPKSPKKRVRVGLVWRSHLNSGFRAYMYVNLTDLKPIISVGEVDFISLQHKVSEEESRLLDDLGVVQPTFDLFNDFDSLADLLGELDLIVGISTFPTELGGALGTPVWMLGFSPETVFLRNPPGSVGDDILTANSRVISPKNQRFWQSRQVCIDETVQLVKAELEKLVETNRTMP